MNNFEKNIIGIYKETGRVWLDQLPKQVQQLEALWGLKSLKPFDTLTYNYVLSGYKEEKSIVLKLSLDVQGLAREVRALEAFAGCGAVSVLNSQSNALLLERAVSGTPLSKGDRKAVKIACDVMERLHKAPLPDEGFPHIREQLATLDKEWELPKAHLYRARALKNELLQTLTSPVLLHGDLHRDNILSNGAEWLVIDPKGVIGFPINEMWAFVEDPSYDLAYISKRFNFSFDEVVFWYYVHLIVAACWQVEDHLNPKRFLDLADACVKQVDF